MTRHIRSLTRTKQITIQSAKNKKQKIVLEIRGMGGADSLSLLADVNAGNQGEVIRKTVKLGVVKIISGITKSETDESIPDIKDFDLVQALLLPELTDIFLEITKHSSFGEEEKKG